TRELALPNLRVVLALGRIAHDSYLDQLRKTGVKLVKKHCSFARGAVFQFGGHPILVDSYHVSIQITNTGRLIPEMLDAVLTQARRPANLPPLSS
ncbi:MAG: uracil-DNA glycosylase, partial [bacterium]